MSACGIPPSRSSANASTRFVAGYEDANDADRLRYDPAFQILADQPLGQALGSQPTLSRWENAPSAREIVFLHDALLDWFVQVCGQQVRRRGEILLDIDSTDDPTYGHQQLSFFNGAYNQHMYHPLLIFERHTGCLLAGRQRLPTRRDWTNQLTVIDLMTQDKEQSHMQKITPFLWFDDKAEEAMNFYVSIFKNSKAGSVSRYGEAGPGPKGTVMVATFQLEGQEFMALNGGPHFKFTEAVSFLVNCETQEEVDELWEKLSQGDKGGRCGWLKDKYGLSWQIVPTVLGKLMQDKDAEKAKRVMNAVLQMEKLDINRLKQAYDGG